MCLDPEVYSKPEEFNPERFMGDTPEEDPMGIIFGFGRRSVTRVSSVSTVADVLQRLPRSSIGGCLRLYYHCDVSRHL